MEYYGLSDIGMKRVENQDTFLVKDADGCIVSIVCDGMGGAKGGKLAAEMAAKSFMKAFFAAFEEFCRNGDAMSVSVGIPRAIKNAVKVANKEIYDRAAEDPEYAGMGTTLVGCVLYNGTCYAVNVGDSRLYCYCDGELRQITSDHTYLQFLKQSGTKVTKRMEKNEKGVITRALGPNERVVPDTYVFDIGENDCYVMCSDGLYNMIGDREIEIGMSRLKNENVENVCRDLVHKANQMGGKDNITAVIIKV